MTPARPARIVAPSPTATPKVVAVCGETDLVACLSFNWRLSWRERPGPADFLEDVLGRGGPNEWLGVVVVGGEIRLDGGDQIRHRLEHPPAKRFAGEFRKQRSTMFSHELEVGMKCR